MTRISITCSIYLKEFFDDWSKFAFFSDITKKGGQSFLDDMAKIQENLKNEIERIESGQDSRIRGIDQSNIHILKNYYEGSRNYTYDNFIDFQNRNFIIFLYCEMENYFFKCLRHIFTKFPNQQLRLVIERRGLSYLEGYVEKQIIMMLNNMKYREFFDLLSRKWNLNPNFSETIIRYLTIFREIRNLFAHHNGIIDRKYLENIQYPCSNFGDNYIIKNFSYQIGDKFIINKEIIDDIDALVVRIVSDFDKELIRKYSNPDLIITQIF